MVPEELRARRQWLAWKYATRKGRQTKVPLSPLGGPGKSNDPTTWGTYRQALACLEADGIGFVFAADDPYTGIDIDGCVSTTGAVHEAVHRIVKRLNSYWEFSPSGRGIHIVVRAHLPRGRHTLKTEWGNEFAAYSSGRYFSVDAHGRGEIREAQAELNALISFYFPEDEHGRRPRALAPAVTPREPPCGDDVTLVDRLLRDGRMAALWRGETANHGGDHSAADLALCAHLAFLTGNDAARIDSLFRRSGLMRDKWDRKLGDSTYGQQTIVKALR